MKGDSCNEKQLIPKSSVSLSKAEESALDADFLSNPENRQFQTEKIISVWLKAVLVSVKICFIILAYFIQSKQQLV